MESPSDSAVILPRTPQGCASLPSPHSSSSGKQPMSATLRERLRKTRFSFNSCYSVVKRLKVENEDNDQAFPEKASCSTEENCLEFQDNFKHIDSEFEESSYLKNTIKNINACESKSLDTGSCSDLQNDFDENLPPKGLNEEKAKLVKQIQEKEDLLRRLKLVKMYRSKNDLSQLQLLIKKWRSCSQLLLHELQSAMSEENKKLSLTQLIDYYGLDDKLLHYNRNEEEFIVALKSSPTDRNGIQDNCRTKFGEGLNFHEGEFLLQALNGFVLVVTTDALVFYASSTIQDYLGFQQSDVIHQSVYELIHTEDRAEFQRQLHWALNPSQCTDSGQRIDEANGLLQPAVYYDPDQLPPENSSFMERCFICRLRCLLDNSSGFLAMNFQGRLKYLHGQNKKGKDGSVLPPQLALFAIATPLQPPSILEIRTKNFIFRTKHKLDFTPTGCDAKGKLVLGYTEAELCMKGSGYQFLHAADMLYCAEYHMRMIKTGESGMIVFRLLTKGNRWTWIQSNARLVYKNGRPDYIIATQRPLTDEEGTEHLKKRNTKLPFMFATGEAVLYETTNPFPPMMDPLPVKTKNVASGKDSATQATLNKDSPHPSSLFSAIMQQDESIYLCPASSSDPFERIYLNESMDKCSKWQDSIAPVGSDILEHEQIGQSQEMNPTLPEGHGGLFPDNNNSDLYSIMKHLGVDFEDVKHMQQNEEFFRTDFSGENDFRDIDLTDEILTFVQDSFNKSTLACPGYQQQPSRALNSSCMVQEHLQLEQQHQKQVTMEQQQQLCQKMKNMQVNGMFANWSSNHSVPFNCPQQDLQPYNVFSDLPGTNQEFPYKSEIDTMPYTQNFIPCDSSVLPQQSQGTQLDFPLGNFEPSPYPTATSNLEDFVTCLQAPENQKHKLNLQSSLVTPQTCYSGAVSMYPYQLEPQQSNVAQIQYSLTLPGPQAFLTKFPNGVLNEIYPAELNTINNSQTTTHLQSLHHASENGPFPDLTSSRFL